MCLTLAVLWLDSFTLAMVPSVAEVAALLYLLFLFCSHQVLCVKQIYIIHNLDRVDDHLPTLQREFVAELRPPIPPLHHGLDLEQGQV